MEARGPLAPVEAAVHCLRIAVDVEDDRNVDAEARLEVLARHAVRMPVGARQREEVNDVDDADPQLGRVGSAGASCPRPVTRRVSPPVSRISRFRPA
jgi:hypothetical protein